MKTLYKIDSKGKLRQWTMEIDDANGQYRAITGIVDGKLITNSWTKVEQKNIGRSNETSLAEQAIFEATSIIEDKLHEGYIETKEAAMVFVKPFNPMLANKWEEWDGNPKISQPKLDGIRCLISANSILSRNAKPIISVPHIEKIMQDALAYDKYSNITFDGELYNHEYKDDFNTITSIVRKVKNLTEEDVKLSREKIQYHVYDMFDSSKPNMSTIDRQALLSAIIGDGKGPIVRVRTTLCNTKELLDELNIEYLAEGYEGQMVRDPGAPYDQKRSKSLLKRKPLYEGGGTETEYEILEILEGQGNWAGKAKMVVCKLNESRTFKATIKGNMVAAERILKEKDSFIKKLATVVSQGLTPDGIPRFPIATDLGRDDV